MQSPILLSAFWTSGATFLKNENNLPKKKKKDKDKYEMMDILTRDFFS